MYISIYYNSIVFIVHLNNKSNIYLKTKCIQTKYILKRYHNVVNVITTIKLKYLTETLIIIKFIIKKNIIKYNNIIKQFIYTVKLPLMVTSMLKYK